MEKTVNLYFGMAGWVNLIIILTVLIGCTSDKSKEAPKSKYFDYGYKESYAEPEWDSSEYYAVKLCDCEAGILRERNSEWLSVIDHYDFVKSELEKVINKESRVCDYWDAVKAYYSHSAIEAVLDKETLRSDPEISRIVKHIAKLELAKTRNILDLHNYNCKLTAPYYRLIESYDFTDVARIACVYKQTGSDDCYNTIVGTFNRWFFEVEKREYFKTFLENNCPD